MPTIDKTAVKFTCRTNAAIAPVYTCKTFVFNNWNSEIKAGEFKQQVQIYSILFKKHSLGVENSSFFLGLLLISCIYRVIC